MTSLPAGKRLLEWWKFDSGPITRYFAIGCGSPCIISLCVSGRISSPRNCGNRIVSPPRAMRILLEVGTGVGLLVHVADLNTLQGLAVRHPAQKYTEQNCPSPHIGPHEREITAAAIVLSLRRFSSLSTGFMPEV